MKQQKKPEEGKKKDTLDAGRAVDILESIGRVVTESVASVKDAETDKDKTFYVRRAANVLQNKMESLDKVCSGHKTWRDIVRWMLPLVCALFVMSLPIWLLTPSMALAYVSLVGVVCVAGYLTYYVVRRTLRKDKY